MDVGLGQFYFAADGFQESAHDNRIIQDKWCLGVDKFHFKAIPPFFYKVDVTQALIDDAPLMLPHEEGDQFFIRDVIGGSVLWSQQHMKA